MTYYIPMHTVLSPLDGPNHRSISRMRARVDGASMRTFVSSMRDATLFFDLDHFDVDGVDQDVYGEAYKQLLGSPSSSYQFGGEPTGTAIVPSSLIQSYTVTRMSSLSTYDVLLICVAGKAYQVPNDRRLVSPRDVSPGSCLVGPYASLSSRTEVIENCAQKNLSCIVVRAASMDTADDKYAWEDEHRIPSIFV